MKTVHEVASLSGVSVRALHHYDAIGLLPPTRVTGAGYRLYDDKALLRLQRILLLRELRFSLKEIRDILDTPGYDPDAALCQQIQLLEMQRDHLDGLIRHARQIQKSGGIHMDFSAFHTEKMDEYAAQAKEKWGKTEAYREFRQKIAGKTREELDASGSELMDIFRQFGAIRRLTPDGEEAQALVAKLQSFISDRYYTCTKPILRSLGQMYAAGDSMTENIDRAGGPGTAAFTAHAIEVFCG